MTNLIVYQYSNLKLFEWDKFNNDLFADISNIINV